MARNMAKQYLPTMFFIDYDEAMIAEHKGKPLKDMQTSYESQADATLAYLRDHFILLNPELYVLDADDIVAVSKACLKVMTQLQGDTRRFIDGTTMSPEKHLELIKDYVTTTYGAKTALVDFNKTTRSVKNAQYVKDIYCCFIPSQRSANSK